MSSPRGAFHDVIPSHVSAKWEFIEQAPYNINAGGMFFKVWLYAYFGLLCDVLTI